MTVNSDRARGVRGQTAPRERKKGRKKNGLDPRLDLSPRKYLDFQKGGGFPGQDNNSLQLSPSPASPCSVSLGLAAREREGGG